jgi:membrane-bound lytic murein transglycosylase F
MRSRFISYSIFFCTCLLFALYSCTTTEETEKFIGTTLNIDLPEILQKGKLTVLAENSSASFFIYRGKPMGFEYEILKEFCRELGVELEIKTVTNLDDLYKMLNDGEGDLAACNLAVTNYRKELIDFTLPFLRVPQILIQRKTNLNGLQNKIIRDPVDLMGKKVHVWNNSSYFMRLQHLQEETGDTIYVNGEDGQVGTEELIEMVSKGLIDYTVADENIAKLNQLFFDNLDISTRLSEKQKIAFGLRKTSPLLKQRINRWLTKFLSSSVFTYLSSKYFELKYIPSESREQAINFRNGNLSAYDVAFKSAAAKYNWDWLLLAAIAYKESGFNPNVRGLGGAFGIMQFMPSIGPLYGVNPASSPEEQINGGMLKLSKDFKSWSSVPDRVQREKFTLATYNSGRSHVEDAQRLAKKYGLDPLKWDDNVEVMMLNLTKAEYYRDPVVKYGALRGARTYHYVKAIYNRYLEWRSVYK